MTGRPDVPAAYTVRVAEDLADREACFALRKEVFVAEQGVPEEIEYDAYDAVAVHVLAVREDGLPLGTGRLLHGGAALGKTGGDTSVGSLGRLAVSARRAAWGSAPHWCGPSRRRPARGASRPWTCTRRRRRWASTSGWATWRTGPSSRTPEFRTGRCAGFCPRCDRVGVAGWRSVPAPSTCPEC